VLFVVYNFFSVPSAPSSVPRRSLAKAGAAGGKTFFTPRIINHHESEQENFLELFKVTLYISQYEIYIKNLGKSDSAGG